MISVCMATYNGEKYIKDQLLSILKQIGSNDEIIISDDLSKDKTIEIIEDLNDSRIKIFFNDKKGYTNNFQNAIKQASGDYIFLSDQDDIWVDNKLKIMSNLLMKYDFVVSDAKMVNANLESLGTTYFELRGGGENGFMNNLKKLKYIGCCMAFRKIILKKVLPFPSNSKLCPHDFWIAMISEFYFKTYVVNNPLLLYRRHGENVSTHISSTSLFFKIQFRVYSFFKVILRFNS
ncbi:glycosyltransferase family 2 protein [Flavobacterium eburneipallidum]|uniref:glycosyltransferase family 2 protein n=1 Tax=Flavobacterium eburneipallidum TaxID=3003263 RepID=UPI002482571D|nr:glycosyltransferase family 2 protein [Flavobacterium eburneipallidum]